MTRWRWGFSHQTPKEVLLGLADDRPETGLSFQAKIGHELEAVSIDGGGYLDVLAIQGAETQSITSFRDGGEGE